jgi:hypothetical protein
MTSAPAPTDALKDEREAFERWATTRPRRYDITYSTLGGYADDSTDEAWLGWQARASAPSVGLTEAERQVFRNVADFIEQNHHSSSFAKTFRTLLARAFPDGQPKVHYAVLGGGPCEVCGSTRRDEVCREGPDHHP